MPIGFQQDAQEQPTAKLSVSKSEAEIIEQGAKIAANAILAMPMYEDEQGTHVGPFPEPVDMLLRSDILNTWCLSHGISEEKVLAYAEDKARGMGLGDLLDSAKSEKTVGFQVSS